MRLEWREEGMQLRINVHGPRLYRAAGMALVTVCSS